MKSYEELLAERDALAAQVEAQQDVIKLARNKLYILSHNRKDVSARCLIDADKGFKAVDDYLSANKTPQQCLAEIKAEAYEAGFMKAKLVYNCELGYCSTDIHEWFDEWESVKARQSEHGTWLKDSNVNGGKRQGGE